MTQTGTCTAKQPQGGPCIFAFACEGGLYCAGADTNVFPFVMGSCEPASLLGEACDPATASNSLQCGALFACDEATSSCFAGLPALADCSQGTNCSSGLTCTSDTQLCEQPRPGGAACGAAGDCDSGRCVGAVCDAPTACD